MPSTICLNMIVKNEEKNIVRLFNSVKGIIDDYIIVDTGSTDSTITLIENCGINGRVFSEPFKNFEYNRTHAIKMAEKYSNSDYLLFLDADMVLMNNDFTIDDIKSYDVIQLKQVTSSKMYSNIRIAKRNIGMTYVGVTHEYQDYDTSKYKTGHISTLWINDIGDGGAKNDKFERDIRLLLQGIVDEPNNPRYYFYLAQSYKDIGKNEEACEYYKKRSKMGGYQDEIWYSYYMLQKCSLNLKNFENFKFWGKKAYQFNKNRAEPIYEFVKYYRTHNLYGKAYKYYKIGSKIPLPPNGLFVEYKIYKHYFDYELSIIGYYLDIAPFDIMNTSLKLINDDFELKNNVIENMRFYTKRLDGKIYVFDTKLKGDMHQSSTSIIKTDEGFIANIRLVNYTIDNKGNYIYDGKCRTENCVQILDSDFNVKCEYILKFDGDFKKYDTPIIGIEDVRIFPYKSEIYYMGNSREYTDDGGVQIITGKMVGDKMVDNKIIDGYTKCEKNWVFFENDDELLVVYNWHPFQVGNISDNKLVITNKYDTPNVFSLFRGSSSGCERNGIIWFVTHSVVKYNPRIYVHWLVGINKYDMRPIVYSDPFHFEGIQIEYSLGLFIHNSDTYITYSVNDNCSKMIKVATDIKYNYIY